MNITLRPSGGRGEYELTGQHGDLRVPDVVELPIFIEILPGMRVNAHSKCVMRDGKPRIRLDEKTRNAHPSSLIAAALMLPKPRRERAEACGEQLLIKEHFVVQTIKIDAIKTAQGLEIRPVTVRLENNNNLCMDINFAARMTRVIRIWNAAKAEESPVAQAILQHADAFTTPDMPIQALSSALPAICQALDDPQTDLIPILEKHFGLQNNNTINAPQTEDGTLNEDYSDIVSTSPEEARIERVKQWRLAAIRGYSSRSFKNKVTDAYDTRCLFTGQRLPKTDATSTAGVDAAHILPWSQFDLDEIPNGICLNKQCHWAFDEGILRLSFDTQINSYLAFIPGPIKAAAARSKFDLSHFAALARPIPLENLPKSSREWPSRRYLDCLNRFLDGK